MKKTFLFILTFSFLITSCSSSQETTISVSQNPNVVNMSGNTVIELSGSNIQTIR